MRETLILAEPIDRLAGRVVACFYDLVASVRGGRGIQRERSLRKADGVRAGAGWGSGSGSNGMASGRAHPSVTRPSPRPSPIQIFDRRAA
jgi:hypothetical protein